MMLLEDHERGVFIQERDTEIRIDRATSDGEGNRWVWVGTRVTDFWPGQRITIRGTDHVYRHYHVGRRSFKTQKIELIRERS